MNRRARDIFNDAVERPAEERASFLAAACGGDAALRARVEALLAVHDSTGDAPSRSTAGQDISDRAPAEGPGSVIGPYKLLQKIGAGGFGVVYMAEQSAPIRRRVALKIIKQGMDTEQVIARFEAERQALAMMDHPNIAHVLDAGATDAGRPYFVMELVRGVSITEYCDTNTMDTRGRLALFRQVCDALQHAHQKGIIHRDLKPTNVMVTLHDGVPVPKVIDFGIAKATHQRLTERTLFTEYRQFVGTPAYMSPEQAEMSGLDVDTRSDIYSLGVLLYELLTGTPPFDRHRLLAAGIGEVQRVIREEEPPKPSSRISRLGQAGVRVARNRRSRADLLSRSLRGDLDSIVMKALEKDRTRRYGTASEFASDVVCYLEDQPVVARSPSTLYRVRKFLRRHRGPATAASLIALILVLGMAGTVFGLVSAGRSKRDLTRTLEAVTAERNRAIAAEARAAENAQRARQAADEAMEAARKARLRAGVARVINDFLNKDLLSAVAPSNRRGQGRNVRMRDVLEVAAARIETAAAAGGRLAGRPLVEASIRWTIGHTMYRIGQDQEARRHLERALGLWRQALGEGDEKTQGAMHALAGVYLREGKHDLALDYASRLVRLKKAKWGDRHVEVAVALANLAKVYRRRGQMVRAEATLDEAQAALVGEGRRVEECRAGILRNLTEVLLQLDRVDEAATVCRKALAVSTDVHGPDNEGTLVAQINLVSLFAVTERWAEAESLMQEVVERCRRLLGERHVSTLKATAGLAKVWRLQGRTDEAQALLMKTVRQLRAIVEPDHKALLEALIELGKTEMDRRRLRRAFAILEKVVEGCRRTFGSRHFKTFDALNDLGATCTALGRYDEARRVLNEALRGHRRRLGMNHAKSLVVELNLSVLERETGDLEKAGRTLLDVLTRGLKALGERAPVPRMAVSSIAGHGAVLFQRKRGPEAVAFLEKAAEVLRGHDALRKPIDSALADIRKRMK